MKKDPFRVLLRKTRTVKQFVDGYQNWLTVLTRFKAALGGKARGIDSPLIRVKMRDRTQFLVRDWTCDVVYLHQTYVQQSYLPPSLVIGNTDIVLDIGAHIGSFTLLASKHAKQGQVFAFEPEPANFSLLQKNIALNKRKNIRPFNAAISTENGSADLFVSPLASGCHSLLKKSDSSLKVKTTSLEQIFNDYQLKQCDFLKMDCEGMELPIITKAKPDILKKIQQIALEYHMADWQVLVDTLKQQGFSVRTKQWGNPKEGLLFATRK